MTEHGFTLLCFEAMTCVKPTLDRNPAMTLTELYDELDAHDWYYAMSDDHQVYLRGTRNEERLTALAPTVEGGKELLKTFQSHYFSGPAWNNEQAPKPQRPKD